jgi:hypothetical protein
MEFKKLSDVEVVAEPAESANVLIEENGVIKKAPKTAVGGAGGGGETPDMVITVNSNSFDKLMSENCNIAEGSVANVFAAFHAGRYPIIKIRFYKYNDTDYTAIREEYDAYVCTYGESIWISVITSSPYTSGSLHIHKIYMNNDGTISSVASHSAQLNWME